MSKETLLQRQQRFAEMAAKLIQKAVELGYKVTLGDAYRDPRVHGEFGKRVGYGESKSFHKLRLAIDLNLFKDGKYLPNASAHSELGAWWEAQGGSWGGRFQDANHYSLGE